jgi:hypothetical protein
MSARAGRTWWAQIRLGPQRLGYARPGHSREESLRWNLARRSRVGLRRGGTAKCTLDAQRVAG